MIRLDHIEVAATDPRASAYALASILGTDEPTLHGPPDMIRVTVDHGTFIVFYKAPAVVRPERIAFDLDAASFAEAVRRLRERNIPFSDDPADPTNGRTHHPYGGAGRLFYVDADGHRFELEALL